MISPFLENLVKWEREHARGEHFLDSRTPQERKADSEIKSITTTSMDKITINTILEEFITWLKEIDKEANGGISDDEWTKKYGENTLWDLVSKKISHALKLYSEAVRVEMQFLADSDIKEINKAYNIGFRDCISKIAELNSEFWENK